VTGDGPLRVYVLRDGEPCCIASCDEDALGFMLRTLKEEDQITNGDCVGILERYGDGQEHGRWLVNPWPATPFGTRR
jgi:hypothetical protein